MLQPASEGTTINIPPNKHYDKYVKVTEMEYAIYTGQTGKFPVCCYRWNYIHVELIEN